MQVRWPILSERPQHLVCYQDCSSLNSFLLSIPSVPVHRAIGAYRRKVLLQYYHICEIRERQKSDQLLILWSCPF